MRLTTLVFCAPIAAAMPFFFVPVTACTGSDDGGAAGDDDDDDDDDGGGKPGGDDDDDDDDPPGSDSIEGTWDGDCNTEDQDGYPYTYDFTLELTDDGSGSGDFATDIVVTYTGNPYLVGVTAEADDLEGSFANDVWTIEGEFEVVEYAGVLIDMSMEAEVDGDSMSAEIELDWGDVEETGDCDLSR